MRNTFLTLFFVITAFSIGISQFKTKSVLAEGEIFKLKIEESGIYQLTYDWLKQNTTLNVDELDPNKIQIFSNPGGTLPLENSEARVDDLQELPRKSIGFGDGSFDQGDKLIFYAEGADVTRLTGNGLQFIKGIYDEHNYVFLKLGNDNGIEMESIASVNASFQATSTTTLTRYENDVINLLGNYGSTQGSGKIWFGETFTNDREQDFSSAFNGINPVPQSQAVVTCRFAGRSPSTCRIEVDVDGQTMGSNIQGVNLSSLETLYANTVLVRESVQLGNNAPSVSLNFTATGANTEAWLDYIQIEAEEQIDFSSGPQALYDPSAQDRMQSSFKFLDRGGNVRVWDITNIGAVTNVQLESQGSDKLFGYESASSKKQFLLFDLDRHAGVPISAEPLLNQNLHGLEGFDMIIITHPDFIEPAQKLALHRESMDGLKVEVVNIFDIYNEYAGGKQDPVSIRDMCRIFHITNENFKYLLLLGDASYDYRGITPNLEYQNFVPTYETDESTNPISAFPSDDYFGLLSDTEGSDSMSGQMDIGIGRLPAKTSEEADDMIEKIIRYDTSPERFGEWRTNLGFAADDVDASWDKKHLIDADSIARGTAREHPCYVQQKVYFDSYVQEATPGGARYPDANKAITDNIFKGQLLFNYLGHGGPKGLSQERVLQIRDVRNWNNIDKLPVFITATCSFTGFDEPNFISAGEHLILNPNGGAVAIFTTVRAVFAESNRRLTQNIYNTILDRVDGAPKRLGDILLQSQNGVSATNTRKFCLIGDPSMTLALPRHSIKVTGFNGQAVTETSVDTIGSLSKGSVQGEVVSFRDSTLISSFSGRINITIFDKESTVQTLVNDGMGSPLSFKVKKNILYRGSATVTNGKFEVDFIIPKDIDFEYGPGSIHMYATDDQASDAVGCYEKVVVGGGSTGDIEDNEGPEISIFFNDRSFVYGGQVNKDPILLVDLEDENGINLSSSSIGHDITATLEDQNGNKIVLNEFYEPAMDKLGAGTVTYQMDELSPGPHKIYIKAWDVLNNSSEELMEFEVFNSEEGFIDNVLNYPNPMSTSTQFSFEHDLVNTNLNIQVSIYTISGKLIKTILSERYASGTRIGDITWDARDDYGSRLAKGVYLYKINVLAPELNVRRESDFNKLVILN